MTLTRKITPMQEAVKDRVKSVEEIVAARGDATALFNVVCVSTGRTRLRRGGGMSRCRVHVAGDCPMNPTPQQQAVADLIRQHYTYQEIAGKLGITERTVRLHVTRLAGKIDPSRPKGHARRIIVAWLRTA